MTTNPAPMMRTRKALTGCHHRQPTGARTTENNLWRRDLGPMAKPGR